MNELYEIIEERIKQAGYSKKISGREFYCDVSDEADQKENGTYMFIINKTDTLSYRGCMTITESEFDLHYVDIIDEEQTYHVDFDA